MEKLNHIRRQVGGEFHTLTRRIREVLVAYEVEDGASQGVSSAVSCAFLGITKLISRFDPELEYAELLELEDMLAHISVHGWADDGLDGEPVDEAA